MTTWLRQNRGFLIFLLCFAFFRTAMADWNPIPSGSMRPTLLEGDVVLVINGSPAQYSSLHAVAEPTDSGGTASATRAIERFADSERTVQFLPAIAAMRNFGPVAVPNDSYFMLGDNRDDSADSHYIGFVPRRLLIGRAHHILVSANIMQNWLPRLDRIGARIL